MVWTINYSGRALKSLRKMDKQNARRIVDFMDLRIAVAVDPRQSGKPSKANWASSGVIGLAIIVFCVRSEMTSWLFLQPLSGTDAKFTTKARYTGFFMLSVR